MTEVYPNRIVWAEIPVTDLDRAVGFYEKVIGEPLKRDDTGPNPMAMLPYPGGVGAAGHLYPGAPAGKGEGITAHLAVDCELDDAMARVGEAGGEIVSDVISIPAGSFFYAIDTEGNSLGIFKI
ncbi:VOC family protein [Parasphingopyxis algicola]|uniref:VOC family protein n=1 Tax=Parasphingopyxis algicola TaxID=2026624 RepID=UPI0015A3C212|nr:VOC family protein [Parasphingopyxis algicola]QLC23807.1 VOC family protein [Parasphingopyxis algicola]